MGETISLSVLSQSAPADQVVKQIETPRSPDPIMRRPCADREEKRVTRGSDTAGSRKHRSGDACLTDPNQRRLLGRLVGARLIGDALSSPWRPRRGCPRRTG